MPATTAREAKQTILIVDDEPQIARVLQKMLEYKGYAVLASTTPTQAIRLARRYRNDIDLLVIDVIMPSMSGFELSDRLKKLIPDLTTIYLSGYVSKEQNTGNADIISKPITFSTLSEHIEQALAKRNLMMPCAHEKEA